MRGVLVINEDVFISERFQRKLHEDEDFKKIYLEYLLDPNETNKKRLNESYIKYEKQLIALKYLRKVVVFEAKRFDSKIRKRNAKQLSFDAKFDDELTFFDILKDEKAESNFNEMLERKLEEAFVDARISSEILSMTDRQQEIIYGLYVKDLTEVVLAERLGITQQAVSKTHRKVIKKLRKVVAKEC